VTLLTNLQIFICESHKNAFGSWAVPGPLDRSHRPLAVIRGRGRKWLGIGMQRKGREGQEGEGVSGRGRERRKRGGKA